MDAPASESVRSDAHLQPPGTATFQSTSFSSSVNAPPTLFSLEDEFISSTSPRDPTLEQEQAIATLKNYHNSDIIAWHTLSQSIAPGLRHRDGPGGLSIQVIHAISILRDFSRGCLIQLLESSHKKSSPNPGLSASRFTAAASSRQTRRQSPRSDHVPGHLSLNKSIKTISPHLSNNPYSALTTTQRQLDSHRTCPRSIKYSTPGFVKPANPDHLYWCTICDNHSYQHSDGWKKHEKEHETKYVCMLKGLFEATKDGRRCVLCGALDQDDSHHSVHNIAPCIVAVDRPSFKRRYDMVGHLTDAHGISDISKGGIIADTWRCKSSKKAWSCGFCIQLFPSLQNRLKHIGTEHFEKGQSINDWDFTKVILGLLLQRKIQEAWQHLMESLDPFRASETKWNKLGSEDLLYRLERGLTGKETPQTLAKAAYDSAEYDWSPTEDDATVSGITVNTMSNQYTSKGYSPSSQDHTVASAESSMEGQPWSSPQHQAFQIPSSSRISEAQSVYQTAALNPSPAHPLPALDYGPGWKLIASDTDDMSSTRPTTPCNDTFNPAIPSVYTPWSGYNISPDPAHSDQEQFHYKSNDHVDWSAHSFFDTGFDKNGSSLKRPRDSVSPTDHTLPCDNSLKDRPRKKMYRNRSEEDRAASRGFDLKYVQGPMYDDEDTPIYGRANGCLSDDVEK